MNDTNRHNGIATPRRFKPYPTYKESGVEWLTKIPAHWVFKRLKLIASVRLSNVDKKSLDGEQQVRLCNYTDVYYNERITDQLQFMAATATPDQIRHFSLRAGDVLITKDSESWTDIAVPAVVAQDLPGVLCGYHLALIRPTAECDGAFLSRAFAAVGPRDQFQTSANGITRFGLGTDVITSSLFAMPPLAEQRAIAAFLDQETARIDALLAKKERLIELLHERRTALVARAVTKGLDPTVSMKHSTSEKLGKIPAHWVELQLGYESTMGNGSTPSRDRPEYWVDGNYPWLTSTRINDRVITRADEFVTLTALEECHLPRVEPRSVLIAITGEGQTRGRAAFLAIEATINQHLMFIKPQTRRLRPEFVRWFLDSLYQWLRSESSGAGSTRGALTAELLKSIRIAAPPLDEQDAIVDFLNGRTIQLDLLIANIRNAINRLNEARLAIISAAATGKIDVRGETA